MSRSSKVVSRKIIGYIGVDAGLCWIGDPCYILHNENGLPKDVGKNWGEFCDKLYFLDGSKEVNLQHRQFNYDSGHEGLGVVVSTGYGDGTYPVYAEFEDGRVARITVDFMSEEDEDDDE